MARLLALRTEGETVAAAVARLFWWQCGWALSAVIRWANARDVRAGALLNASTTNRRAGLMASAAQSLRITYLPSIMQPRKQITAAISSDVRWD